MKVLNEDEFVAFYYKLMRRPEIDEIFKRYTNQVEAEGSFLKLQIFSLQLTKHSLTCFSLH